MINRLALAVALATCGIAAGCSKPKPEATKSKPVAPTTIYRQANAQEERWSPHETISRLLEGNHVTITYGRPHQLDHVTGKPRPVWGGGPDALVPVDKIWRLGADEATTMVTQQALNVGGTIIPAGAYTLFMILNSDGSAVLVVNREIGQWGIDPYHIDHEFARIPLQHETISPPVEQFTITLAQAPAGGGILKIMWDDREFSVPYKVAPTPTASVSTEGSGGAPDRGASHH